MEWTSVASNPLSFLGVSFIFKLLSLVRMQDKKHKESRPVGKVTRITIFPVKSMKGIDYDEVLTGSKGLFDPHDGIRDRAWMITDSQHHMVTARQLPKIVLIQPSFNGDDFILDAPGMDTLIIPKIPEPEALHGHDVVTSVVWKEKVPAYDVGEKASAWLSVYLDGSYRLVYHPNHLTGRILNQRKDPWCSQGKDTDQVAYQDCFPYFLLSEASVEDLNTRLESPVTVDHFRPNILVEGCGPYSEDEWEDVYIGDSRFVNVKPCTRCVFTTIDPETGKKNPNVEPLKTLRKYRLWREEFKDSPMFGINLLSSRPGKIQVGDTVYATIKKQE